MRRRRAAKMDSGAFVSESLDASNFWLGALDSGRTEFGKGRRCEVSAGSKEA